MYSEEKSGLFNAIDIANYLNFLHNNKFNRDISPLKLQKVLFFLFGEWGGFIEKSDHDNDGMQLLEYSKYLFDDEFEAWVYGPVVPNVYRNFSNEQSNGEDIFIDDKLLYVKNFINDLALELFELSDFRLVELSHQMKCWINNFKTTDDFHDRTIDKDVIISEFANQF